MTVTLVQQANNFTAAASTTATLGATPTVDNLLVAVASGTNNINADTITGFTQATVDIFVGSTYTITILYRVVQGGDGTGYTMTHTASSEASLWIGEYSSTGTWSLDVVANDGSNSATGGTTRPTGTTTATAQSEELAIGAVGQGNTSSAQSWSNSFAVVYDGSRIHVASKVLSATATQTSTMSWTTTRVSGGCIAVFKAVAGAVVNPTYKFFGPFEAPWIAN